MKISRNWIKKYIDLPADLTDERISRLYNKHVAEVEEIIDQAELLDKVYVGRVEKLEKHPNADKLTLCQVALGSEHGTKQIVCGGSNLVEGIFVAVAIPGARVKWHGEGEPVTLEAARLRGEESFGMICASEEIGLGDVFPNGDKEIWVLDGITDGLKPGALVKDVLEINDVVFDIENKTLSNRPDLWGHYGFARELSAILNLPLKDDGVPEVQYAEGEVGVQVADSADCPRYTAVKVSGVKPIESPDWLKAALESIDIRSINAIVDVTNYVMADLGQPMHAFDATKVSGEIVVRRATEDEKMTLLDESEITLTENDLVIADNTGAIALAGIMGGANSEVSDETTEIIIESATFAPSLIRKSSTTHSLRTDASSRFEKSLDPYMPPRALAKALGLLKAIFPEMVIESALTDVHGDLPEPIVLHMSMDDIARILGTTDISQDFTFDALRNLGFEITEKEEGFEVVVPSWRATKDIELMQDVVEEVLRMYGYDNVPARPASRPIAVPITNKVGEVARQVRMLASQGLGMNEVYNYSFTSAENITAAGMSVEGHLELENPIAKNIPYLRQSLAPNMFDALARNYKNEDTVKMFEVGRIFLNQPGPFPVDSSESEMVPAQPYHFAALYYEKGNDTPFYNLRNGLQYMLGRLNVPYQLVPKVEAHAAWEHPVRSVSIVVLHEAIGSIAEVHPMVCKAFGLPERVAYTEIDFEKLTSFVSDYKSYKPASKFPTVELDFSFVLPDRTYWSEVEKVALSADTENIVSAQLFDTFVSEELRAAGKKSVAFRVVAQSYDRTFDKDEISAIHEAIVTAIQEKFDATLRA